MAKIKAILVCGLSALMLFGCGQKSAMPTPQSSHPQSLSPERVNYQTKRVRQNTPPQTHPGHRYQSRAQTTAKHLANLAAKVPHVRDATAITAGNYTIVGIDVDPRLDRGRVGTVKYSVAQALKKDPRGTHALVTADTDLVQRVRELSNDVAKGKPISGIINELADIAGRIAPQSSRTVPSR
jgi:YhcN/YlaJ family sporulation lipoprotein